MICSLSLGGGAWFFGIANPVLYMIVLALITGFILRWTRFGRYVYAIGGNEHAATLTGVPVKPIKVAVYMISSLSAGIAGIIQTGWLGAITTNIGAGLELQVIAAAVIGGAALAGGVGTATGAIIGAALIEVIRNSLGLLGINAFWQGCFHRWRHIAGSFVRPGAQLPPEQRVGPSWTKAQPRFPSPPLHRKKATPQLKRGPGSVHSSVAEAIGMRIVRGEFAPGTILPNEAKWATDFKVSRSAVREGIKILMAKNLLISRPKVGSRVEPRERWSLLDHDILTWYATAPNREKFLLSLQQFRYIVEPEAAALAAEFHTEEQMHEISAACHDMATAPSLHERTEADVRFHIGILKATNNELLLPLGVIIDQALNNLFIFITRQANDLHHAQDLHEKIERNIRLRKPQAARIAVRNLLANSDEIIKRTAAKNSRRN